MTLPITDTPALVLAVIFGGLFGSLLFLGNVTNYNTIVNQFRFKDFTVLKVMLTAILVGGVGVYILNQAGLAQYHIKPADLLGVALGSAIFGVGMVLYGYCPGTGVAAVGQGSVHALVGFLGMLVGGMLYAFSFSFVKENILTVASYGKVRLPDITGIPDIVWFLLLSLIAGVVFTMIERHEQK
jgi:uncharacterized membrane protein YedE/YeeE